MTTLIVDQFLNITGKTDNVLKGYQATTKVE